MLKDPPANAGATRDPGPTTGSGRPGEGKRNPLQYSYLENSMDRGIWRATVHGVIKSRTRVTEPSRRAMQIYKPVVHRPGGLLSL